MTKRVKSTENKAKDVEKQSEIEKLWAQYGRLQAERERLGLLQEAKIQQMRNIYNQIAKLEQK